MLSSKHVSMCQFWLVTQWSLVTVWFWSGPAAIAVCWLEPDNDQVVIDRSRVISVCRLYRPPTGQPATHQSVCLHSPGSNWPHHQNSVTIRQCDNHTVNKNNYNTKIFFSDCSKVHFIWSSLHEDTDTGVTIIQRETEMTSLKVKVG